MLLEAAQSMAVVASSQSAFDKIRLILGLFQTCFCSLRRTHNIMFH